MSEVAAAVLAAAAEEDKKYGSIQVEKPIELELDLGNMLAIDNNQTDVETLRNSDSRESYLMELARDNTQILINSIWNLPTERVEDVVVAKFPPPTYRLPREKPVPKPKQLTKWEKYAKDKGITKTKKKDRVVWDDLIQQWVPQFGYKKNKIDEQKNWCIPIKETADPNLDPFSKMAEDKKERVAKNELQRLRNVAKAKNIKLPTVGVTPVAEKGNPKAISHSDDLKNAAELAKVSTASLGKFQPNLSKKLEKTAKAKLGKKRKFESNTGDNKLEKDRNMDILESITNKKAKIDIGQAVGKQVFKEDTERSEGKRDGKKGGKGKKGKGGKRTVKTFSSKGAKSKQAGPSSKPRGKAGGKPGGGGKGKSGKR